MGKMGGEGHAGPLQGDAETTDRGAGCEARLLNEIQGDFPSGIHGTRTHLPVWAHEFKPWFGEIPQAVEQLSPCAMTPEAHSPWSPRSVTRSQCSEKPGGAPACCNREEPRNQEEPRNREEPRNQEEPPLTATRENPYRTMKTQSWQK